MSSAMQELLKASGSSLPERKQETTTEPIVEDSGQIEVKSTPASPELDTEVEKKSILEEYESKLKEARDEAARRRIENKALKEQVEKLFEEEKKAMSEEVERYKKLAQELSESAQKEKSEGDKKKANEVSEEAEKLKLELKQREDELKQFQKQAEESDKKLKEIEDRKKLEQEVRDRIVQEKIDNLMKAIPDDKKKFAEALVKGSEDKETGYMALIEAKNAKLFDNKVVEVQHGVPKDSDRSFTEDRSAIKTKDKLREGLKKVRQGIKPGERLV
jgi:chromosome segregation ATPase